MKTILKLAGWLVGAHLLSGVVLLVIEATHGINDQDASFAAALLFHYLNFPSVWLLRWMGVAPGIIAVLLVGIVQWTALAAVIGGGYRAIAGRTNPAARRRAAFAQGGSTVGCGVPSLGESSPPQAPHSRSGCVTIFQRWKWGLWFAGVYLLVSVPCAVAYLVHSHEYSIPGMILQYASLPAHFLLFDVFHPLMRNLGRWPHGETLVVFVLLVVSTGLYFAVGHSVWRLVKRLEHTKAGQKPGVTS